MLRAPPSLGAGALRALAVLALAAPLAAQRLVVRTFSERDGLPSSRVYDVREAPSGELWFATLRGPYAHDGSAWRRVLARELPGERPVGALRFDGAGRAWALAIDDESVVREGAGVVTRLPQGQPLGSVLDVELLEGDGATRVAVLSVGRGIEIWDGGTWRACAPPRGLSSLEPCFGRLLVGGEEGLLALDACGELEPFATTPPLPAGAVLSLAREGRGADERLWILGVDWVGSIAADRSFALLAEGTPPLASAASGPARLVPDGRGGVLYGDTLGVWHVDARARRARRVDRSAGLAGEGVNALARDADGLLWGVSDNGAFQLLGFDVETRTADHGLLDDRVTALAELPDGRLVLGHYGGLSVLDGERTTTLAFERLGPDPATGRVMDLFLDGAGTLWIAGLDLGLGRLEGERVRWIPMPAELGGVANAVREDAGGRLLVGTTAGLLRREGESLVLVEEPGLERPFVRRMAVTQDGAIALATTTGLRVGREGRWHRVRPAGALSGGGNLFTVHEDGERRLWCGGLDGLWRVEGDALVRAGEAHDVERPVFSLVEDGRGRLWTGTDLGFARSDGARLASLAWLAPWTGVEANRGAALAARDGRVWLGTMDGVTTFAPGFDVPFEPPRVELCGLAIDGRERPPDGALELPSAASEVALRARARTFLAQEWTELRWRLRGAGGWTIARGPSLDARVADLAPGAYRFEVQARRPGGEFGASVLSPLVRVPGPWWRRGWFLGGLALAALLLLLGTQRALTQRRLTRRLRREMEARTRALEASLQELARSDRLRSLGTLAGGIAHDLRNVLLVLEGNLSLLRASRPDTGEAEACFDASERALERARQLSSQLQTFATGGEPMTRPVSLADLARDTLALVLSGSRVRAELEVEPGLSPAEADPAQIRQVLENLVLNARESQGDAGWVRVRVAGATEEEARLLPPGRYVSVTVADGGPGIAEADLRHVFDPFFTTKVGGTGLGLATALSIVRRHGGRLEVVATSRAGTTLRVLLPASSASVAALAEPEAAASPARTSGRVLVIDDEPAVRALLLRMLGWLGHPASAAGSSAEAVELLERALAQGDPYRFAIVDQTLPGDVPGPEVLRRLRALAPELRAVATSGYSDAGALSDHAAHGFQAALPKPYRLRELAESLQILAEGEEPAGALPAAVQAPSRAGSGAPLAPPPAAS